MPAWPVHARDQTFERFPGIVFPSPAGGQFAGAVAWARTPSDAVVRAALPASVHVQGWTEWVCAASPGGRLHDCDLQTSWPRDPVYEQAGRKLMDQFLLSEASAKAAQAPGERVVFRIVFWGDGLARPNMTDCPPPFCTPVPSPPPPPSGKSG